MVSPTSLNAEPLPSGTLTFLFTDIEGSTRLLGRVGERYAALRAQHFELLRRAISGRGSEFGIEGDALFAAFEDPGAAITAAVDAQRLLNAHPWPDDAAIRVRMGVHTGPATVTADGYVGLALHETARLASAGHGGQILVSDATRAVHGGASSEWSLADLGEHEFKDLAAARRVFEVRAPALPTGFPPLRARPRRPGNLPVQLTSFLGRDDQVGELSALVAAHRLVTLTGAGGSGKTRLALTVAESCSCAAGAWFVDLAALTSNEGVADAVAAALGFRVELGHDVVDGLVEYMGRRDFLIVLDNCEHVIDGAAKFVDRLLRASLGPRVIATSQEPLEIDGEWVWPVPTLEPDAAVELFLARARAAAPGFDADDADRALIAQICSRLDGIPLAIELAAGRVAVLPLPEIARRLDDSLRLLTGGRRTAVPRHQTLRAALEWSYGLLSAAEQDVFDRLSVFAAGFGIDAVEALTDPDEGVEIFGRLVAKSLVIREGAGRYRFLDSLRQLGRERLAARAILDDVQRTHAEYWRVRAADYMDHMYRPGWGLVHRRIEEEQPNLRVALEWARAHDLDVLVDLVAGVGFSWFSRGMIAETDEWVDAAAEAAEARTSRGALYALYVASAFAMTKGAFDDARRLGTTVAERAMTLGEPGIAGLGLENASIAAWGAGDLEAAHELALRARERARSAEPTFLAAVLPQLARTTRALGDLDGAEKVATEAIRGGLDAGEDHLLGWAHDSAADVSLARGEPALARARAQTALTHYRLVGYEEGIGSALNRLASIALVDGEVDDAGSLFAQAAEQSRRIGHPGGTIAALEGLAAVAAARGDPERSARCLGGAAALRERTGTAPPPDARNQLEDQRARLVDALGSEEFDRAFRAGLAAGADAS